MLNPISDSSLVLSIKSLRNNQGLTLQQIADSLDTHYEHVRKICHTEQIIKPRNIIDRLSEAERLRFKTLYLAGETLNKQLADTFFISVPSVKRRGRYRMRLRIVPKGINLSETNR